MARKETSEQLPTNQTVISQGEGGVLRVQHDASIPKVEPDMVLVKNVAVAMNPCDWKMPTNFPCPSARDGCDFAGTIVQIGSAVTRNLSIGSRVCGAIHASNPDSLEAGSFAQYTAAYADLLVKIPDDMPWENAAAIGGGVVGTLGLALFQSLDLPAHPEKPAIQSFYVLVYGASTSSGTMAIQLLRWYVYWQSTMNLASLTRFGLLLYAPSLTDQSVSVPVSKSSLRAPLKISIWSNPTAPKKFLITTLQPALKIFELTPGIHSNTFSIRSPRSRR